MDKDRIAFYASFYLDNPLQVSLKDQFSACFTYLERHDYDFVGFHSDMRYIASTEQRHGLMNMLRDARDGKIDKIFMYRTDRLALNHHNLIEILRRLQLMGVKIFTCIGAGSSLTTQFSHDIWRAEQEAIFKAAMAWEASWDAQMAIEKNDESALSASYLQECTA